MIDTVQKRMETSGSLGQEKKKPKTAACILKVVDKNVNYKHGICVYCNTPMWSLHICPRCFWFLRPRMCFCACDGRSSCLCVRLQCSVCQLLLISAGEVASVLSSDKSPDPGVKECELGAVTIETFPRAGQCRTPQQTPK